MADCKREIMLTSKKVKMLTDKLASSTDSKNVRLVQKYETMLQESLDKLMQGLVDAEIEGVDINEAWLVEGKRLEDLGQSTLLAAEEFLTENEGCEEDNAKERVNEAKLAELVRSIGDFRESLKTSAKDLVNGVESSRQHKVIHESINQKRGHMLSFKNQKIELVSTSNVDSLTEKLNYRNVT